jgi:hypothetical protein
MDVKEEVSRTYIPELKKTENTLKNNMFKITPTPKPDPVVDAHHTKRDPPINRFKNGNAEPYPTQSSSSLFSKEKKPPKEVLDVNNGEMFPSLDGDTIVPQHAQWKQPVSNHAKTTQPIFDYKTIIVKRRPPPEPTDDIPVGWAKLYYDEYGQYVEDYKPTPGWRDPIPIERAIKHRQEVQELFNERERDKRERIELFGEEGMYFQERDPFYTKDSFDTTDASDSDGDDVDAVYIDSGYKSKGNRKSSYNDDMAY